MSLATLSTNQTTLAPSSLPTHRIRVLGVPCDPLSFAQTLSVIDGMVAAQQRGLVITANLNWAMLQSNDAKLAAIAEQAAVVVADGMPLVWASWLKQEPLPERVAGSDLLPALCQLAAERGYRVFFLGAAEGVGRTAAEMLIKQFPALQVVGVEAPHLRSMAAEDEQLLLQRIRESQADIVFAAFGQPIGEAWLATHLADIGHAVVMQVGASIDFVAGRATRAPRWMQRTGCEWLYRLWCEPRRMGERYARNAWFLLRRCVQL